jgi:prepilin-type N-terminal cleavage/methylation domain-containing protein
MIRENYKNNKFNKAHESGAGFTLIELLIVMGIVAGIAMAVGLLGSDLTKYSLRFNNSLIVQQEMQQTLQIMLPEIRSIAQSNNGAFPIISAASGSFAFYSDIDRDGGFDQVRYFLNGTTFQKGVIRPTGNPVTYPSSSEDIRDMVHNIMSGQIFSYYGITATSSQSAALPAPVDPLKVKTVKISLIANQNPSTSTPSIVGVENEATIRNLRYK